MSLFNKMKILVTHNGTFHADDLFACALLSIWCEKHNQSFKIVRTRDKDVINSADIVFDVGGAYDEKTNRFDHHQKQGAGKRDNGIPYASLGLIWKHFGLDICDGNQEVWNIIDRNIASPLDAADNGLDIFTPKFNGILPYLGSQPFLIYQPTWKEDEKVTDQIFIEQTIYAKKVLKREVKVAKDDVEGINIILSSYKESKNKQLIMLNVSFPRYLFQQVLSSLPEPIYVVYPSSSGESWKVEAISKNPETFESRKSFPESWRGLMNGDPRLKEVTGVSDAVFCHSAGFLITVVSKEGAIALAEKALMA